MPRRNELTSQIRQEPFEYRAAFNADNQVEYEAWAEPGSATSDEKWCICKHTYTSNNLTATEWANGGSFLNIFDNKEDYF